MHGRQFLWVVSGLVVAVGGSAYAIAATPRSGDATRGALTYAASCGSCHSLDSNRVGPAHRRVYGSKAGSAPGYGYSMAVKKSRIIWDAATLDRWLENPRAVIPGTKMAYRLADEQKRADIIAYLRRESAPGSSRPEVR